VDFKMLFEYRENLWNKYYVSEGQFKCRYDLTGTVLFRNKNTSMNI
jgi:hypothetical protein